MAKIEVTEAQRKKCTQCKHSAIMPKDKERGIDCYVCTAHLHKYDTCKHKEAIQNYWELVLEAWIEKLQEKKEKI